MREYLEVTDLIADIGIIAASIGAILFVFSYGAFFNWRRTPAGRALMYVFISLGSVALLAFAVRWLGPEYLGRELFRPLTWWAVAVTVFHLVWVLWSNWRVESPLDIESRPRNRQPSDSKEQS